MGRDITQDHIREIYKEDTSGNPQEQSAEAEYADEQLQDDFMEEEQAQAATRLEEQEAFLHEKVKKDRGIKFWWKGIKYIVIGAVVGATACLVFYVMAPWAEKAFQKEEVIDIPQDTVPEVVEESVAEAMEKLENAETSVELDIENVKQYSEALRTVAAEATHSMVTITGEGDQSGWLDGTYVVPQSASGLIIAETESEVLVLTSSTALEGASSVKVTFSNTNEYPGSIKGIDNNTGLAVISIDRNTVDDSTADYYKVAALGNSYGAYEGTDIFVLGSPYGFSGNKVFGYITGKNGSTAIRDSSFTLMITDIAGGNNPSGVVFNTSGEVVGFITPTASSSSSSIIMAIPISDIKAEIEKLSNGEGIPYIGINGKDVDFVTASKQGLAEGIFIMDVEVDSPAMTGGLQAGDIIQTIDNKNVQTMSAFRTSLLEYTQGSVIRISVQRKGPEGYTPVDLNVTVGTK